MQPETLTNTQLIEMGYRIEEYIEEYWSGPVYNEVSYYRIIAPDGQVIAEDLGGCMEAVEWARWHAAWDAATPQPPAAGE